MRKKEEKKATSQPQPQIQESYRDLYHILEDIRRLEGGKRHLGAMNPHGFEPLPQGYQSKVSAIDFLVDPSKEARTLLQSPVDTVPSTSRAANKNQAMPIGLQLQDIRVHCPFINRDPKLFSIDRRAARATSWIMSFFGE
jgi:hypothetical protein